MEAFQFHSFEVDDTLMKTARLGGRTVANPEEPAVEVADETALKHTRKTPAFFTLSTWRWSYKEERQTIVPTSCRCL